MNKNIVSFMQIELTKHIPLQIFKLFKNTPFHLTSFIVPSGKETPLDQHAAPEYWIISSGGGLLIHNEKKVVVSACDVVYFSPFDTHQVYNNRFEQLVIFSLYW